MQNTSEYKLLVNVLHQKHHTVGNQYQMLDSLLGQFGHVNDAASLVEFVPTIGRFLGHTQIAGVVSTAGFANTLLFPVQQSIGLINVNNEGLEMYSCRAIAYTMTAWAFDRPIPKCSPKILQNGLGRKEGHQSVWDDTSRSVLARLENICNQQGVDKAHLKKAFRAFGNDQPAEFCRWLMTGFEDRFGPTTIHIWRSTYKISFPN